ncbi:MAG TPA: porin family protein [Chitinophaga sp.]|uniref:porin family protein n=1 Tax=Chitinophaga sp. TaxID=1869181 RepID=UPI002F92A074
MKKIVLLVLLSLGISSAYAQINFGILAGLNNAIQRGRDGVDPNSKYSLLWHAGIAADIPLAGRFYLQPQLLASVKGSGYEAHDLDTNVYFVARGVSDRTRMVYLEIPVNIIYKHSLGPGKLIAGAGPYIAYGLGGKSKTAITNRYGETSVSEPTIKFKNETRPTYESMGKYTYYKPLDGGLNFIAGYELNNGLCFNINYSLGLMNIEPSDGVLPDGTHISHGTKKNSYFGLSVGYFLRKHN